MKKKSNQAKSSGKKKPAGKKRKSGSRLKLIFILLLIGGLAYGAYWMGSRRSSSSGSLHRPNISSTLDDIQSELSRSGKVVRRKAENLGNAVADTAADSRNTMAIKSRLLTDPKLSVLGVSVNTTDGVVTLAGSVSSDEEIYKIVQIALESDGTKEVVSNLKVKEGTR